MSRIQKEVPGTSKKILVNELTVRQCKALLNDMLPEEAGQFLNNEDFLRKHWPLCIEGVPPEEVEDLYPSELKKIYDVFQEVNAAFFEAALAVIGENPFLQKVRAELLSDLIRRFAGSSNAGTPESGTTDTASSSQP